MAMKVWTTAAATLAMLSGLAIGAAVAPVAEGQSKRDWTEPSVVQLIGGGGRLGVSVRDANDDDLKGAKLPAAGGVVIEEVREDSPAQKAGLKAGDLVVEFDGERVRSTRQFTRLVQETPAGRHVQAVVVRDGQRTTLSVQTEEPDTFTYLNDLGRSRTFRATPPIPPTAPAPPRPTPLPLELYPRLEQFFSSSGRLGITVDTLSDQLADYFGTKDGVLVTSVTASSAAAKAGLKAGDVITAINGSSVTSHSDLSRRTQRLDDGDEFTLEIVRDKKTMTLKGKIEQRQQRRWTTHSII
jgi:serine protease Do